MGYNNKWHEWGVIGQSHNPYLGEIIYCPLCRQYENEDGERLTKREVKALIANRKTIGNPIYEPSSDILLEL